MAGGGERKSTDFYAVLGLEKECTPSDLKSAYKKLAMRWHPDRCSASGNSKFVEEAKKKFQAIQEAYSVLSDETKRLLYDVGIYDNDDDENNDGMGEFLNEMVAMMSDTKPSNGEESFEQLQELFEEMFQADVRDAFPSPLNGSIPSCSPYSSSMGSSFTSNNYKRSSSEMNNGEGSSSFNGHFQNFCVGVEQCQGGPRKGRGDMHEGASSGISRTNSHKDNHNSRRRQGEGKAENRRFHPVRTSFPVVMLVFQLEDDRESAKIKLKP